MRLLEAQPDITQRELASSLEVSLGRVNYCLKALAEKGWVKMEGFAKSESKSRYVYLLTPSGLAAKSRLTASFLRHKLKEYEALGQEIQELERDVQMIELEG